MADVAVKAPKKKIPPMIPEEFLALSESVHADLLKIGNYYTGVNKRPHKGSDEAPSKIEFNNLGKAIDSLGKHYAKMAKKPKRAPAPKSTDPNAPVKTKGFKQERFFKAAGVNFVNTHGDLPAHLHLEPIPDLNGDAIWSIAQATQLIISYVERHNLKNPDQKTKVTLDKDLTDLFRPYLSTIDRKAKTEGHGGTITIEHKTLQSLIPKLFEKNIPVIPDYLTEETKKRILEREGFLGNCTIQNREVRDAAKKAANAAKAKVVKK